MLVSILTIVLALTFFACDKKTTNSNGDPNPVDSKDLIDISSYLEYHFTSPKDYENNPTKYMHEKIDYPHGYYTAQIEDNDDAVLAVLRVDDYDKKYAEIEKRYHLDDEEALPDYAGAYKEMAELYKKATLTVPATYKGIPVVGIGVTVPIYELNLSSNTREVGCYGAPTLLSRITVPNDNPYFRVEDNCLIAKTGDYINEYEKDMLILACNYTKVIPSSVTSIGETAFPFTLGSESIEIPSTVKEIKSHAFHGAFIKSIVLYPETKLNDGCICIYDNILIMFKGTKAQWLNLVEGIHPVYCDATYYTVDCMDGTLFMNAE